MLSPGVTGRVASNWVASNWKLYRLGRLKAQKNILSLRSHIWRVATHTTHILPSLHTHTHTLPSTHNRGLTVLCFCLLQSHYDLSSVFYLIALHFAFTRSWLVFL